MEDFQLLQRDDRSGVVLSISLQELQDCCVFVGDRRNQGRVCELELPATVFADHDDASDYSSFDVHRSLKVSGNQGTSSPEIFPIVFSVTCLTIAVLFTLLVALRTTVNYRISNEGTDAKARDAINSTGTTEGLEESISSSRRAQMMTMKGTSRVWSYVYLESSQNLHVPASPQNDACPPMEEDEPERLKDEDESSLQENGNDVEDGVSTDDDESAGSSNGNKATPQGRERQTKDEKKAQKRVLKKRETKEAKKQNEQVILSWKGVGCSYPSTSKTTATGDTSKTIVTLQGASGALRTGELTAIMGGSGGGKSTLLDILSGRKNLGTLVGEMSILGRVVGIAEAGKILRDVAAYVPQNEMFFPTQTPEEAVTFFANLKLGRDPRGADYRHESISGLLDQVGLSRLTRSRPIGGSLAGGVAIRGLSGGERKRLALACAVAMRPSILFLDEITR